MEMPSVFKSTHTASLQVIPPNFKASNQDAIALGVTVTQGEGHLPKLLLTSEHGSEIGIYLFGGCITSSKDMVFQWWKQLTCHISGLVKTLTKTVNQ
ncbi:hypothetical protein GOBAR_DD10167 [Gossypium barbadense]|nr:hypothetical protein GOBAR_DD10167 [Gossypium barbadense]